MANSVLDTFAVSQDFIITLDTLASSTNNSQGRESDLVDNTSNRYQDLIIYVRLVQGATPTGNRSVKVYLIRSDSNTLNEHISDDLVGTDNNYASKELNAELIGVIGNKNAPNSGDVLTGEFLVSRPGPKWGVAISHDTGDSLAASGSWVRYIGLNPEIQ